MENPNSPNGMSSERTAIEAQRAKLQQAAQETLSHLQQKGEEARAQLAPKLDAARTSARELQHQAEATVRERPLGGTRGRCSGRYRHREAAELIFRARASGPSPFFLVFTLLSSFLTAELHPSPQAL